MPRVIEIEKRSNRRRLERLSRQAIFQTKEEIMEALNRFAVAKANGAFRKSRHVRIVRDEDKRGPSTAIQFEHDLYDHAASLGVEIAGWLIGEKNLGTVDERAGERDALLFPAGKLRRIMIDALGKPYTSEQIQAECARATIAPKLDRNRDVLQRRQSGDQLEILKYKTDMLVANAGSLIFSRLAQCDSIQKHGSRRWPIQSGTKTEQRRLAAARWPEDRTGCALSQNEGNILKHRQFTAAGRVGFCEALNVEDRECSH